ncbi:substrate-binding periplasmic protein [Salidesulfovibrio onnuriiensis]|uniref:substrate-binding periplasmic protein n=1 Tax=Salidesulfovibrio onnuriiensis TaxID=2583823 RepID=UPI0011CCB899|nr:transporter substrate-binding domain-containing protein [Salidesulfovibrio onnuriiensis]
MRIPRVLLVAFFLLLLVPVRSLAAGQVLVCGIDDEPFGPGPVKVLREAYAALGYNLAIRRLPNARSVEEANAGRCDGELGRVSGISDKFPNLIMVDVPIYQIELVAVSMRRDWDIRTWKDLGGKCVAHLSGTVIIEKNLPEDMEHEIKVQSVAKALTLLEEGRADVVVTTRGHLKKILSDMNFHGLVVHEPSLEQVCIYHYLHKKDRALVRKLEAVLRKMQQQGRISSILGEN